MKCEYLNTSSVIEVSDYDYKTVLDELKKLTIEEWKNIKCIVLNKVEFKETAGEIFDLIQAYETPQLEQISLSETLSSDDHSYLDIKKLNILIKKNLIKKLDLTNLYFASNIIDDLIQLFKDNPQLQDIELYCSHLEYNDAYQKTELFNALKSCNLKKLYVSGFELSDTDIDFLIELVQNGILHLDMGYNDDITTEGLERFLGEIVAIADLKLESIELSSLKVSKEAWDLIDKLKNDKAVAQVEIDSCKAGSNEYFSDDENADDSNIDIEQLSNHTDSGYMESEVSTLGTETGVADDF